MLAARQLDFLQRRLELMHALLEQLRASQAATVALDSERLRKTVGTIADMCNDLRTTELGIRAQMKDACGDSTCNVPQTLLHGCSRARAELRHACRVQAALLRKAHAAATVQMNVFTRYRDTYITDPGDSLATGA